MEKDPDKLIGQFEVITGCSEQSDARKYLEMFAWDLEPAINAYLENKTSNNEPASTENPSENYEYRQSFGGFFLQTVWNYVLKPLRFGIDRAFWLLYLLYRNLPLGPLKTIVDSTFGLGPFNDKRDPVLAQKEFVDGFESRYGSSHVVFYEGSYNKALDKAKKDLQYFFVYLHSKNAAKTDEFCRDVMASERLIDYMIEREFVVWAGDIEDYEAYRASIALGARQYPFTALILRKQGRMQVIERTNGYLDVEDLMNKLTIAIEINGDELAMARSDRAEQELSRRLREEQDRAYLESLEKDKQKQRTAEIERENEKRKLEELEREKRQEEERRMRIIKNRERLRETMPQEPTSGKLVKVAFRLPDGSRVSRKFHETDTVELLYHFAGTHELHIDSEDFIICSNFPRKEFENRSLTLVEAGLSPAGMVVIEESLKQKTD